MGCMQEHILACMVEGIQVRIPVGILACMPVVGTQARMAVVHTLVVAHIPVGMVVARKQVGMVAHIQVWCCSSDCWNIPPIGAPSCIEEATRHKFPVVFSL